jgi:hypothetical protein
VQEIMACTGIRANIDPGQNNLPMAVLDQSMGLPDNIVQLAAARPTACEGNNAKGTGEIAAILDFYLCPGLTTIGPDQVDGKIAPADLLTMHNPRPAQLLGPILDEFYQAHLVLGTHNEIESLDAL